ncbi:MAG: hypothetical protein GEU80_06735 [Dehalococcoidia bacterium]|nr:hypothetical protein [Dehalococcoidia bacterium]
MSEDSIQTAGIIMVVYPSVVFGGVSILWLWITRRAPYLRENPLRQRLWAAGHAHAGVLLILSLVALLLVDQAELGEGWKSLVRSAFPLSAILLPAAYFLSVLGRNRERPSPIVNLAYLGAISLTAGMLTLGVGLLRAA